MSVYGVKKYDEIVVSAIASNTSAKNLIKL